MRDRRPEGRPAGRHLAAAYPASLFTLLCSTPTARLLPLDPAPDDLHRYRGVLVTALLPDDALRVELVPLPGTPTAPTYVADLATGDLALRLPC